MKDSKKILKAVGLVALLVVLLVLGKSVKNKINNIKLDNEAKQVGVVYSLENVVL